MRTLAICTVTFLLSALLYGGTETHSSSTGRNSCSVSDLLINEPLNAIGYRRLKEGANINLGKVDFPSWLPVEAEDYSDLALDAWNTLSTSYKIVSPAVGNIKWYTSGFPGDPFVPAVAPLSVDINGYIVNYGIAMNIADYDTVDWDASGDCPTTAWDVWDIVLHEAGHIVGLKNVSGCIDQSVMAEHPRGTCKTSPGPLDIEAVTASLYCGGQQVITEIGTATRSCGLPPNPAADISDFELVDGRAVWTVLFERNTAEYILEGCMRPNGPGVELTREAAGVGPHSVNLGSIDFPIVRLVERETTGQRIAWALWNTSDGLDRYQKVPRAETGESNSQDAGSVHSRLSGARARANGPPTYVIFTPTKYMSQVQSLVEFYWESRGHVVEIVDVGAFPAASREDSVKSRITTYYSNSGTKYFHLIGDGRFEEFASGLWDSSPYWRAKRHAYQSMGHRRWEAADDGIPLRLLPDAVDGPLNTARSTPYVASDLDYGDVDSDGVPDVVVTRWPVESSSELATIANRMQKHNDEGVSQPYAASFLVGDVNLGGENTGVIAKTMADLVQAKVSELEPTEIITRIYDSDFGGIGAKNDSTAQLINLNDPELIVILSSSSKASHPGRFFYYQLSSDGWFMGRLKAGTVLPIVLAASCEAGFSTATSSGAHEICEDFLFEDQDRGAVAWVGPTAGSYQDANYRLSRYFVEELYGNPGRAMGESWLIAVQRAIESFADSPELIPTVLSYAFLGDPLSPFRPQVTAQISSFVRKAGEDTLLAMPDTTALGCPQGDIDAIVVSIAIAENDIVNPVPPDSITISQPPNPGIALYGPLFADSALSLSNGYWRTTLTVSDFGGCGIDSALVKLHNIDLGYAHLNVKSPDQDVINLASYGDVDILDMVEFAPHFPSSICNCQPNLLPYDSCADFAPLDTLVDLADLAKFSEHWGHVFSAGGSAPATVAGTSAGTLRLELEENYPLIGSRKLIGKVVLDGLEPYSILFISFKNGNPILESANWHPAPAYPYLTASIEVSRNGQREIVVLVKGGPNLGNGLVELGYFELYVNSTEPLNLGASDLTLAFADLLTLPSPNGPSEALSLRGTRFERSIETTKFQNQLVQNYPNPFNPTTTIAFSVARDRDVEVKIYNVRGALVRTLVNDRRRANNYKVVWNGRSDSGNSVASGVYFYRLRAGDFTSTRKMVILR